MHLLVQAARDGDVDEACSVIVKVEAFVVKGRGDAGAAAARLIQDIMETNFRGWQSTSGGCDGCLNGAMGFLERPKIEQTVPR